MTYISQNRGVEDIQLPYRKADNLQKWKSLSPVWLFVTPRTIQSMEFSRPEYFPSPGDLSNPGIKSRSPAL